MPELNSQEAKLCDHILSGLNDRQKQAVQITEGPLWVTAGAGSGKTRVLTRRIAYLIGVKHVDPRALVAITFTKKAAGEMQERLVQLIGKRAGQLQISTIHSLAARILREHAYSVGLSPNFQVGDETYQKKVIKDVMTKLHLGQDRRYEKKEVNNYKTAISQAKIRYLTPDKLYERAIGPKKSPQVVGSTFTLMQPRQVRDVYAAYQKQLQEDKRVDFDDLLMLSVKLLKEHPMALRLYQKKWRYFSVDEYQDTNLVQYELIHLLASASRNLCVVGDMDQSIYGFQGADHRNIQKFKQDFNPIQEVVLNQNYRSTNLILKIANQVIDKDPDRASKTLWSDLGDGDRAEVYYLEDVNAQAERVAQLIQQRLNDGESADDIAIIYRMNRASRSIEQALLNRRIPYQVIKGLNFYQRTEIRTTLAYLTLILDPDDLVSWETVINTPRRGFGDASIAKLRLLIQSAGSTDAAINQIEAGDRGGLSVKQADAFVEVASLLQQFNQSLTNTTNLDGLVGQIMQIFHYHQHTPWASESKWESVCDNLGELQTAMNESVNDFHFKHPDTTASGVELLQDFVNNWAIAWQDPSDEANDSQTKVSLMTMHAAKGLEFNTLFIVDAVNGEFPMQLPDSDPEEERRLAYVAITRAKRHLYFMVPMHQMLWGNYQETIPSYFLDDFDKNLANWHDESDSGYDDNDRWYF